MTKQQHFLELKIPPVAVFLVFGYLMWSISNELPAAGFDLPANKNIALILSVLAGILAVGSISTFIHAGTTVDPMNPGKAGRLVTTGVNRISRNPMYLSLLFVLLAWAVYLCNFAAFAPTPLFVAYLTRFQIVPEERMLACLFGREYEEYCKRIRRWL